MIPIKAHTHSTDCNLAFIANATPIKAHTHSTDCNLAFIANATHES